MTVETATYISDLNSSYPESNSAKSDGDNHLRLIKSCLLSTLPNVTGAVTPTHTELNYVDGVTSAIQTQLDAKAPSASPTITGSPTAVGATWANLGTVTTADINGGTIDGTTIATSNITVGAGKTLDVSAGTLTLAADQISGDKIHGGTISNFASTGIDDNAASTAMTIDSSGNISMAGTLAMGSAFSFRNKVIGGDFTTNPWQRGTSFTHSGASSSIYTADRFKYTNSTDVVVNVLKTADAPTAAEAGVFTQHCFHVDVTTADATVTNQYGYLYYAVEGYSAACFGFGQSGTRYVTLSFWHKHTKTGTHCVTLNNSAFNRAYVAEYTQSVTDTWEKATLTIPVDTTGTWLYDNGVGILLVFGLANGHATYQQAAGSWSASANIILSSANQVNNYDSTSNNFKIALVQLEAGTVATPFETRPVGVELALCQRYYYRLSPLASGYAYGSAAILSTTQTMGITPFPVEMRTKPTAVEQSGTAGDYAVYWSSGPTTTCTSVPIFSAFTTERMGATVFTTGATLTAGYSAVNRSLNTGSYLGWSAEL